MNFAIETTLSGKNWIKHINEAKTLDYKIIIYFLALDSKEVAIERIANRDSLGGHHIESSVVSRRFNKPNAHSLKTTLH